MYYNRLPAGIGNQNDSRRVVSQQVISMPALRSRNNRAKVTTWETLAAFAQRQVLSELVGLKLRRVPKCNKNDYGCTLRAHYGGSNELRLTAPEIKGRHYSTHS